MTDKQKFIEIMPQILGDQRLQNAPAFSNTELIMNFFSYIRESKAPNILTDMNVFQARQKDRAEKVNLWWATHFILNEYVWENEKHSFKQVLHYDFAQKYRTKPMRKGPGGPRRAPRRP
jgi:hypothetical protein